MPLWVVVMVVVVVVYTWVRMHACGAHQYMETMRSQLYTRHAYTSQCAVNYAQYCIHAYVYDNNAYAL